MKKLLFCSQILLINLIISTSILGQSSDHKSHHHANHDYELGLSAGMSRLEQEGENAFALHIHVFRRLGTSSILQKTAIGVGVESIFADHKHYSFLAGLSYNIMGGFIVDISPGILFVEHNNTKETHFITHLEFTYEFDFHKFGFGPVIGIAFAENDKHYMIGLHFGKGF